MNIHFIVNPIEINGGWSPWDKRIGGSEETVVEVSKRLAKSHIVKVFHNGQHGNYNGVFYLAHEDYKPGDVTINVNFPEFKVEGKSIYFTSLLQNPNLDDYDAVVAISEYAKANTGLPKRTVVVPLGYDPEKIYPGKKIPKTCLYASSPDRGLDTLLQTWPKVHEAHPDALLIVTYGSGEDFAKENYQDGIMFLPGVDEKTMSDLFRTSDIWCHPCNGGELFCITGKKAQVAGCIPVIIPVMALAETVERGFKTDKENYAKSLIEVLSLSSEHKDKIRQDIIKHANALTWQQTTDKLLSVIEKVLE